MTVKDSNSQGSRYHRNLELEGYREDLNFATHYNDEDDVRAWIEDNGIDARFFSQYEEWIFRVFRDPAHLILFKLRWS